MCLSYSRLHSAAGDGAVVITQLITTPVGVSSQLGEGTVMSQLQKLGWLSISSSQSLLFTNAQCVLFIFIVSTCLCRSRSTQCAVMNRGERLWEPTPDDVCVCVGAVNHLAAAPLTDSSSAGAKQPRFRLLRWHQPYAHSSNVGATVMPGSIIQKHDHGERDRLGPCSCRGQFQQVARGGTKNRPRFMGNQKIRNSI